MEKIYWGESAPVAEYDKEKFRSFCRASPEEIQQACLDQQGKLVHIISAEHFDLSFLEQICDTAQAARNIATLEDKSLKGLLPSKSVLNYFNQPSSRTFLSFSMAESHLGMRREEVRDISTSSYAKGESEKDSLRTVSSYFDALICRHPSDLYGLFAVWVMKNSDREIPVISAGSGTSEHPTQGLLDYYTKRESLQGDLDGKVVAYVGDCLRGRTVHSDAKIQALHKDTTLYFVAPPHLQIDEETEKYAREKGAKVIKITEGIEDVVPLADVIYMTRIQDEHGGDGKYDSRFIFTEKMLGRMKPGAILMHPMPKREEIDPAIDYRRGDNEVVYWRQQRNGMWVRVALLAHIFGVDQQIREQYKKIQRAV